MSAHTIKIDVTEQDIEQHGPWARLAFRCNTCPVAVAMGRVLGQPIFVTGAQWSFDLKGRHDFHMLPEAARERIFEIDCGIPVEPFSFEIEVPDGAGWRRSV